MKVFYFGMIAEATGKADENLTLENGASLDELQRFLVEQYPRLKQLKYKMAVNQSIVGVDVTLNEEDEIALLPPFAGG